VFGESSASIPVQVPLQAELLAYLHVRHLAQGATVFARVTADWSGDDCILRRGAVLEGKVEEVVPQSRGTHGSKLALAFTKAQCSGADLRPLEMTLAAVAGVQNEWTNKTDSSARIPISFSNPNASGMLAGFGNPTAGDRTVTHLEFAGISHNFPMRPNLRPGDVIDIKGLKLDVGTGPNRSSVLSTTNRDITLDKFTQFLLVPASAAFQPAPASLADSKVNDSLPPVRTPHLAPALTKNLEVCDPPGCAVDLPVTADELTGHAEGSIAIGALGYAPRTHKIIADFDEEDTLAWLGPQELLIAFNPHTLIQRKGDATKGAAVRVVRAVVLDAGKRGVLQAVDWELADYGRYLWPLDGNRILVHVGDELRVYSSGLKVDSRIPLAGPLAFVRTSPNGQLLAVATLREQHSPELHTKLRDTYGSEPEEAVDVLILDKEFKTIGSASTPSGLLPPTLLNEGQVKLLAQPRMRYRLAMTTWENKSVTLARFESSCTPQLSSVAPDHLFLITCDLARGATVYRVLRADGKPVLRGTAGPKDVGHDAIGGTRTRMFAVKVVHANRLLSPGEEFQGSELDSEEVRVYRASDGKRLLAVSVDDPPTNRGGYALSPDGSQIAVLAGAQIRFFPVPAE
jgi:hypothetical protein